MVLSFLTILYSTFYVSELKKKQEAQSQLLRQKQKKRWDCKMVTRWDSKKKSQKVLFCLVYLQNENQYALTINAILSRFNCNIRSSKNMRNLGYEGIMRKRSSSGTCVITKYIYTFCFLLYMLDLWYWCFQVSLVWDVFNSSWYPNQLKCHILHPSQLSFIPRWFNLVLVYSRMM